MLSKTERAVLNAVLIKCGERYNCLASPTDLLCRLPPKSGVSEKRLSEILECLEYDGYISVILSDRHGQTVYCIELLARGKGYRRETSQSRRALAFRLFLSVLSAFLTFAVGRALYYFIK
ncbi:MAG: hypothetical protein IJR61_03715 [Clostridia bacterium]|nr:hypothetical protein [Clostridia bacterium]